MEEKISIIVPIYNVEKYLQACIESLIHQTYQNIEILLIDDGSTDKSGKICDYYSKQDDRIKTIHQINKGVAAARNCGVRAATGEYIGFVDPDDWVELSMYKKMICALKKNNADICMCDFVYEFDGVSEEEVRKKPELKSEIFTGATAINRLFLDNTFFYTMLWNKLFKRSLWNGVKFPEDYVHEDEAVIHRVYGNCNRIIAMANELYHYRQIPTSITHTNQIQRNFDFCHALSDRIKYLRNKGYKLECRILTDRIIYEVIHNYYIPGVEYKYLNRGKKDLVSVIPILLGNKKIAFKEKISITIFAISPYLYRIVFYRKHGQTKCK